MTREETSQALSVLKAAYPDLYKNITPKDAHSMLDVWSAVFMEEPLELVKYALLDLIKTHTGYPPRPGDVAKRTREIIAAYTGEPTDEEYWQIYRKAVSNSIYDAAREFAALPPLLQRFAGSPSTLRDHARMDEKTLDTVVKGQFLKQLPALKERHRFSEALPPDLKQVMGKLYKPMDAVAELTDGQYNDRRNAVLDALEAP